MASSWGSRLDQFNKATVLLPETQRAFEKSAEWQQFEEALETVANRQAQRTSEPTDKQQLIGRLLVASCSQEHAEQGRDALPQQIRAALPSRRAADGYLR